MSRSLGLIKPWYGMGWSGTLGKVSGNGIGLGIGETWGNGCFGTIGFGCGVRIR